MYLFFAANPKEPATFDARKRMMDAAASSGFLCADFLLKLYPPLTVLSSHRCVSSFSLRPVSHRSYSCNDPDYPEYVFTISGQNNCYKECPNNYFYHENEFQCLRNCKSNYYGYPPTKLCVSSCLDFNYYSAIIIKTQFVIVCI